MALFTAVGRTWANPPQGAMKGWLFTLGANAATYGFAAIVFGVCWAAASPRRKPASKNPRTTKEKRELAWALALRNGGGFGAHLCLALALLSAKDVAVPTAAYLLSPVWFALVHIKQTSDRMGTLLVSGQLIIFLALMGGIFSGSRFEPSLIWALVGGWCTVAKVMGQQHLGRLHFSKSAAAFQYSLSMAGLFGLPAVLVGTWAHVPLPEFGPASGVNVPGLLALVALVATTPLVVGGNELATRAAHKAGGGAPLAVQMVGLAGPAAAGLAGWALLSQVPDAPKTFGALGATLCAALVMSLSKNGEALRSTSILLANLRRANDSANDNKKE